MYVVGDKRKSYDDTAFSFERPTPEMDAPARDGLYKYFQEQYDRKIIDSVLSIAFRDSPNRQQGAIERLQGFRHLTFMLLPRQADKLWLNLEVDTRQKEWRYEFLLDGASLYQSETLLMGHGKDFAQYKDEYVRQFFPESMSGDEIREKIQRVSEPTGTYHEALQRFIQLQKQAVPEYADQFERRFSLDRANDRWSYEFRIGGFYLCGSAQLQRGNGEALAFSQSMSLLQRFRQMMKGPDLSVYDLVHVVKLNDDVMTFDAASGDSDVYLARNFEAMAQISAKLKKWASIELSGSRFQLVLDGRVLEEGELRFDLSSAGVTPRVQIIMSAFKVAALPLEAAYQAIMRDFDRYRVYRHAVGESLGPTFQEALEAQKNRVRSIVAKPIYDTEQEIASYDLNVVSSTGPKRKFSVTFGDTPGLVANAKLSSTGGSSKAFTDSYRLLVLQGLMGPMRHQMYEGYISELSMQERDALHKLMHETPLADFSLGHVLNVPKPHM